MTGDCPLPAAERKPASPALRNKIQPVADDGTYGKMDSQYSPKPPHRYKMQATTYPAERHSRTEELPAKIAGSRNGHLEVADENSLGSRRRRSFPERWRFGML